MKLMKMLAAVGVLALGGVAIGWGPSAKADAPAVSEVFAASSSATPYGIFSKVPAETDGGFLYSHTTIELGKATGLAAGLTFGQLGDLFIVSSAPAGTLHSFPTQVNAQDPPSATAPLEAHYTGGVSGSPQDGEVRDFDVSARTGDAPDATAQAAGAAVSGPAFHAGESTSHSESLVAPDGTVTTKAITDIHDVVIGPAGAALTIAAVESVATITIPPGGKPVPDLSIKVGGAQLAGVPVTIDSRGISLNGQVALPADALNQFRSAEESFAAQGLRLSPGPMTVTSTANGAKVSGAAITMGYRAPDSLPRPSDIGADETLRLGSVTAEATARPRMQLPPLTPAAAPPGARVLSGLTPPANLAPASAPAPMAPAPQAVPVLPPTPAHRAPVAAAVGPATAAAPPTVFSLPARVSSPLPGEARIAYRWVLLAAAGGLAALIVVRKRTP